MKTFKEFSLDESYAIKHKESNTILSNHGSREEAEDTHHGLGDEKYKYKVIKTSASPKKFSMKESNIYPMCAGRS